jgi:hypothetical protein
MNYDLVGGAPPPAIKPQRQVQRKIKGVQVPQGVVMYYVGGPDQDSSRLHGALGHIGVVTVATRISDYLELGFAFCAPDDTFCRAQGRNLALERMSMNPLIVPYLYNPVSIIRQVIQAVLVHDWVVLKRFASMTKTFPIPSWTRKLQLPKPPTASRRHQRLTAKRVDEYFAFMLQDIKQIAERTA